MVFLSVVGVMLTLAGVVFAALSYFHDRSRDEREVAQPRAAETIHIAAPPVVPVEPVASADGALTSRDDEKSASPASPAGNAMVETRAQTKTAGRVASAAPAVDESEGQRRRFEFSEQPTAQ